MDRLNHRIQRFQPDGTYVNQVGARGTQAGTFSWPEGVTTGPDGSVWAVDTRGDRIERFAGRPVADRACRRYGATGSAVGELQLPVERRRDADGDRLGRRHPQPPAPDVRPRPPAPFAAVGAAGHRSGPVPPPDGRRGHRRRRSTSPTPATTGSRSSPSTAAPLAPFATGLLGPEGIEVAPDGTVWVADTQNSRLVHLSADLADLGDGFGALGTGDHQFFNPHDLAFGNDKMYVADTYNNRVQVYSMAGPAEPPPAAADPGVHAARSPTRAGTRRSTPRASPSSTAPGTSPTPAAAGWSR